MTRSNAIVLIDCENLTSPRQLESLGRWAGAGRVELFGREAAMAPWRKALARRGIAVAAETPVPDDAPSQAADQAIARAVREMAARPVPGPVVIASNDKGFAADIDHLSAAGIEARQDFDLNETGLLRLVMKEIARPDGWAAAGGIGDHLIRRFGLDIRGRLATLAARAGITLRRDRTGLWLSFGGD
ncbi:NYN domain-containing protein [Magnetospirillum sp. 15-1]|uniref:NYN domain-containing protein n=1 Tax=Magnetospirillum sp. 15-1 TaxID=1979370 RepID=UPI000BBC3073|nr:NYN domain-containing protein [Magnetospirillum sp. 15-1]